MNHETAEKKEGDTSLYCGERVCKNNPRIEALGSLDELSSMLGVFRGATYSGNFGEICFKISKLVLGIQIKLFTVGTELAAGEEELSSVKDKISISDIEDLEKINSYFRNVFRLPNGFIIPGGRHEVCHNSKHIPPFLDLSRALTRRLERDLVSVRSQMIEPANKDFSVLIEWINELSDVLWVLARVVEIPQGKSLELTDVSNSSYSINKESYEK